MKKLLLFCIVILSYAAAYSQVFIPQPYLFQKYISLGKYTTATLPSAASCPRCAVYNNDSANFAFSNGSAWLYYSASNSGSLSVAFANITGLPTDNIALMNALNHKVNYTDTAAMLAVYQRAITAMKYSDTSTMLVPYQRVITAMKYSDTAAMLAPYLRIINFTPTNIGLGAVIDSLQVINRGGVRSWAQGTFAAIPSATTGPTFYYATDTNAIYHTNGTSYTKVLGGAGSGGSGADSSIFATRFYVNGNFYPLAGNPSAFLTAINSSMVTTALGFTPYNATNPSGFISGNQSITYTASNDVSGTASGSTTLSPSLIVNGIKSHALPSLVAGFFTWTGTAWAFDATTYQPLIAGPNTANKYWNGYKAFVALNSDSIAEGSTNLFFTNARARSAISLVTNGLPTYVAGVLTIPAETDTIYRTPGTDSIKFKIGGRVYEILDSAGTGAVASVSNSDGTLTISPTIGAAVASLALGHTNTWTILQNFGALTATGSVKFPNLPSGSLNDSIVLLNPATGALEMKSQTFTLHAVQGLGAYGAVGDSLGLGINPFFQPDTIKTAGFAFSITGLPNKTFAATDSSIIENSSGQLFKTLLPFLKLTDTASMLSVYQRANTAMKYTDTAAMLSAYQRSLIVTNIGSSGAAGLVGNTLNIPIYGSGTITKVPAVQMRNELVVNQTSTAVAEGNSITAGVGASNPATTGYIALIAANKGITFTNNAVSNSSIRDIISRQFANAAATKVTKMLTVMGGTNNIREDARLNRQNAITEGIRVLIANQFFDSVTAISSASITKHGTWSNFTTANITSKSVAQSLGNPMKSSTLNDSLNFIWYDDNMVIGTYGWQASRALGSFDVTIDGTDYGTFTGQDKCTDFTSQIGTYDYRQPIVFIFTGLGAGLHNVRIKLLSAAETDFDYIAKMMKVENCAPIVVSHITKCTPAGYAFASSFSSNLATDTANANIDTVCNYFRNLGFPVATVHINAFLNLSTSGTTDGLHPGDPGNIQMAQAFESVISSPNSGNLVSPSNNGLMSPAMLARLDSTVTEINDSIGRIAAGGDSTGYASTTLDTVYRKWIANTATVNGGILMTKTVNIHGISWVSRVDSSLFATISNMNAGLALKVKYTDTAAMLAPYQRIITAMKYSDTAAMLAVYARLISPTFAGVPLAPTAAPGTNTTQIATTAFANAIAVLSMKYTDTAAMLAPYARSISPALTGIPTAPTASPGTNTTQVATTAFAAAIAALAVKYTDTAAMLAPYARSISPTFAGVPLAPTAAPGTNTTQIATTAFAAAIKALDVKYTDTSAMLAPYARLISPTFAGVPAVPTASPGTNTTQAASTAFVTAAVAATGASSGSYTPTITAVNNISSSTAHTTNWSRIGNTVTVSGTVSITITSGVSISTSFKLNLPISSTLSSQYNLSGTLDLVNTTGISPGYILASTSDNTALLNYFSTGSLGDTVYFTFTYTVQ